MDGEDYEEEGASDLSDTEVGESLMAKAECFPALLLVYQRLSLSPGLASSLLQSRLNLTI